MNRLEDLISGVHSRLDGNTSAPVRSGTRNAQGDLWQPPYVRIEKPSVVNEFENGENKRLDVSLLINVFSEKTGFTELFTLEQEVRDALDKKSLDLNDGRQAILNPLPETSTPSTNEKQGREIHQQSVEFRAKIHEPV